MIARWFLALLACCLLGGEAFAGETIDRFVSDVTIRADGTLDVKETITWSFSGVGKKRGLLRDFPTRYRDRQGNNVTTGFQVTSVKRDGKPDRFAMEEIANGKRVRIGKSDVFLDEGRHVYEIAYITSRQLGFFDQFDELYWNVTGNAWEMPIQRAEAVIHLPSGADIVREAAYTGPAGVNGRDYKVMSSAGGVYHAVTTRTLGPSEGFTVAVAFTKGIVAPPTDTEKTRQFFVDNLGYLAMALTVLLVFLYFFTTWLRVGRDPPAGTIVPLFAPPEGLGPAGTRYVWRRGYDDKTFAAAMVGLAVKGHARILDADDGYAVEKLAGTGAHLERNEAALASAIAPGTTEFRRSNFRAVAAMRSALMKSLAGEFQGAAFIRNLGWSVGGLLLSIIGLGIAALLMGREGGTEALFVTFWMGFWWAIILSAIYSTFRGLLAKGMLHKLRALVQMIFFVPFVVAGIVVPVMAFKGAVAPSLYPLLAAGASLVVMNAIFFHLMPAPTIQGRRLLDQIEGFRLYLTTAEEDRLNALNPPEKTPALFEKYLPYAIALDCENEWGERFASILAAAGMAAPSWYVGNHWNTSRMSSFTSSVGSGLATSTASSATAPGSSSGSGGGGSSGGGGGGGGGSSW